MINPTKSLRGDVLLSCSISLALLISICLIYFSLGLLKVTDFELMKNLTYYCLEASDLNLFIVILTTILGALLTILAILHAFESTLKKNEAFKILMAHKKHIELYKRFTDSIFGIFGVIILLGALYFFKISLIENTNVKLIYLYISITALSFGFLRAYRCFDLFKALLDAMERIKERR